MNFAKLLVTSHITHDKAGVSMYRPAKFSSGFLNMDCLF
jgi:hypothetical protein